MGDVEQIAVPAFSLFFVALVSMVQAVGGVVSVLVSQVVRGERSG